MFYITGDTHRDFDRVPELCRARGTTRQDVLIILGDAGINYFGPVRDRDLKFALAGLPITLFCIHGNHEQRPDRLPGYHRQPWRGGEVWVDDDFPNQLFAVDGCVYDLDGARTLAIGGAYSVDKMLRVSRGYGWWEDEQPSDEIKSRVEAQLDVEGWRVDAVLSHTVPRKYEPVEVFLPGLNQSLVDKTTEDWLDGIEDRLDYRRWYCGHFHTEKRVDRIEMLFTSIRTFMGPAEESDVRAPRCP